MGDSAVRVLLDTQAIVKEGFGTSGAFRHLLRDVADRRVELIVPELAVLETSFVFRRQLHKHRLALKELPALLRAAGMPAELATEHLVMLAEKRLRAELERAGVTPVAAPVLDGDDLVKRVLDRRKPTKALKCDAKGKELPDQPEGFRDQLLWAHVRDAAMAGRVVFVTGNIRDFAGNNTAAEGHAELHPQLRDDLKRDRAEGGSIGDVELFLDVRTVVRELLQDDDILEIAAQLLDGDAGVEMRRAVTELVNGRRVVMDEFSPEDLVEGDIEEATLSTFVSADVEVELDDAYVESGEGEPRRYGVNATVAGAGDVDWYVSAPTAGDVHAFGDHVENAEDGGGLLQWRDEDLPIRLWVYGQYAPSTGEWSELRIDYAAMPADELERRAKAHEDEQHVRLQALGLEPTDDEIEAMVEDHERTRRSRRRSRVPGRRRERDG